MLYETRCASRCQPDSSAAFAANQPNIKARTDIPDATLYKVWPVRCIVAEKRGLFLKSRTSESPIAAEDAEDLSVLGAPLPLKRFLPEFFFLVLCALSGKQVPPGLPMPAVSLIIRHQAILPWPNTKSSQPSSRQRVNWAGRLHEANSSGSPESATTGYWPTSAPCVKPSAPLGWSPIPKVSASSPATCSGTGSGCKTSWVKSRHAPNTCARESTAPGRSQQGSGIGAISKTRSQRQRTQRVEKQKQRRATNQRKERE